MYTPVAYKFDEFCLRSGCDSSEVFRVWNNLKVQGIFMYIGGGAIRRILINQPLDSDFDFFFSDSAGKDAFIKQAKEKGLKVVKETQHHTQLEGVLPGSDLPVVVQAIHFTYGDPAHFLNSFDYTITQFIYDGEYMYTTAESLWDLGRRKLALHKVTYPVATLRRMLKYSRQGFAVCSGCMADLFRKTVENPDALGQLDIEYVD